MLGLVYLLFLSIVYPVFFIRPHCAKDSSLLYFYRSFYKFEVLTGWKLESCLQPLWSLLNGMYLCGALWQDTLSDDPWHRFIAVWGFVFAMVGFAKVQMHLMSRFRIAIKSSKYGDEEVS